MKKIRPLTEADVTAESAFFMQRRQVLKALGISAAALSLPSTAQADLFSWFKGNDRPKAPAGKPLEFSQPAAWRSDLALTPEDKVTGYNNFYEFGLDKADPAANAGSLKTEPWTLKISGSREAIYAGLRRFNTSFPIRRAYLSNALRRSVVHGRAVDWFPFI